MEIQVDSSWFGYLCRVLLLDMLLGNPDRLPCSRLMWAGNPGNLLAGCASFKHWDSCNYLNLKQLVWRNKTVVVAASFGPANPATCWPGAQTLGIRHGNKQRLMAVS